MRELLREPVLAVAFCRTHRRQAIEQDDRSAEQASRRFWPRDGFSVLAAGQHTSVLFAANLKNSSAEIRQVIGFSAADEVTIHGHCRVLKDGTCINQIIFDSW